MELSDVQTIVVIVNSLAEIGFFYVTSLGAFATMLGVVWAAQTYYTNQRLERARWASSLFEKFYEKVEYKAVRRLLDNEANCPEVAELVADEKDNFTDYLNFFEHVAYLVECKQISRTDAEAYFNYYLEDLKRHPAVLAYIRRPDRGFEKLAKYLAP